MFEIPEPFLLRRSRVPGQYLEDTRIRSCSSWDAGGEGEGRGGVAEEEDGLRRGLLYSRTWLVTYFIHM